MNHLKKFEKFINQYASEEEKENLAEKHRKYNELVQIKSEIYESMSPSMIEVYEDWSDYFLEIVEKYGKITSKYGDVRDTIDLDGLDLCVDIGGDTDYTIAHEKDYIYQRGIRFEKDPKDIPTREKLSMYASDFDWDFYDYYKKHNGEVNPFYSFRIAFDIDYKDGRGKGWTETDIMEMTQEIVSSTKQALKRLNAKIVKIDAYDGDKWFNLSSKNLDDVKYPNFTIGFNV